MAYKSKETKNVKTREECRAEALQSVKHDILVYSLIFGVALLLYLPFIFLVSMSAKIHLALGIIMFFSLFGVHIVLACIIAHYVKIYKSIKADGVTIVIDRAVRFGEESARRFGVRPYHLDKVIYFRDHDRQVYNCSLFELFSHGDEFYLVVINGKKERVVAIYNTKFYEIKN